MSEAFHAIKAVARRTGLSAHVIRIWEKRYGAVEPERTGSNRRLYSEEQIERLNLLRIVTQAGHSIGQTANLPTDTLRKLAAESSPVNGQSRGKTVPVEEAGPKSPLEDCIQGVKTLDARRLEDALNRAQIELGGQGLLQRVIAPLAQRIGDLWRDGSITAAHEHFASAVIRIFLGQAARSYVEVNHAPVLVVATPVGQLHELGALLAGATASNLGWHVTYLGTSLPAAEIAGAARQNQARAVALSLVYPEDDPRLEGELARLRNLLPADIAVLAGGRAMPAYSEVLTKIGAVQISDLSHLGSVLEGLRRPAGK